ncbi:lipoprotein-releasing system permease protein [Endobacter medicaginis]|uniref:Lipoprotein-releasing ABC transporter permease subunit n=1 Tax=Endobacter medicaginis TaxID=1181271 RepID=A0A839UZ25_9PROT|nr:lipoprotein-releasing ABC transporter permease subunit [Endobacter medicaginis]MBB3173400.1 lipoprotein-releasing system permease protein [Endobacter medicaginis]MCX5475447.1 lipoprotein-releasing ABC transporter permease subunit [Endobacter medicaginis]NVN28896.1 lipoprotein-releasing ABC transporter permease subunit [Endobacter medicaginis]
MFGAFERAVAVRYLRARKGERFVSIIAIFSLVGIALGVATLIIVMSVMNGFKADLLSRILGMQGDLTVYGAGPTLSDYDAVRDRILHVPGVIRAAPVVEGQALLSVGSTNTGGMVRGMRAEDLDRVPAVGGHIIDGNLADLKGDTIAVGATFAARAGLAIGSQVTLLSPNGAATAFGTIPRIKAYRVVAIFDTGVSDYNLGYVFIPLDAAQTFFQTGDTASDITVSVADPTHVQSRTEAIRAALAGRPVRVMDWTTSNNAFFAAVTVEGNVMFLILTLIILVAAFNVISSMIMMVKDKSRDIAILRTIGASRGAVLRIFLMCGAFVGVTGTAIGTLLGVVFCLNIERLRQWLQHVTGTTLFDPTVYYLEHLPAQLDPAEVVEIVAIALALSLAATIYPSWKAARTDPVEALRHE